MSFIELLLIGIKVGLLAFGGALLIIKLLKLGRLIIGFCKYNKLQNKLKKLETQKYEIDFGKLQNDLDHWTNILEK